MKTDISENVFAFVPITTQTILGSRVEGRANFMALAWLTRVNFQPPMIAVSVNKNNKSCQGILENNEFSLNVPSPDLMELTDYTGLVSGRNTDKSGLFEVYYGSLRAAPLIAECPVNVELKLAHKIELPTNWCFIGEVVGVKADETILTNGAPDPEKYNPFVLSMPDNRYRRLGDAFGNAWQAGKAVKEKLKG